MGSLGNPQDKLKVVHVAGTSGKTSTSYFVASLLQKAGLHVGLTVSPHVDSLNERVQIDLTPLLEVEFCKALSEFLDIIAKGSIKPSYFEFMIAFAYWEFERRHVDYAVVEVGLGGLLDATNVVTRKDKICVITDIGLDHTEILGDTLGKIATQKAGIIQEGNHVFAYIQGAEVDTVLEHVARDKHAELHEISAPKDGADFGLPLFQRRNFYLATQAAIYALRVDKQPVLTKSQLRSAALVHIPARMEIVKREGRTIIIDGAHNAQKLQTLFESIHDSFPDQEIAVLAGFVEGDSQRLRGSLQVLAANTKHVLVTSFYSEKDYPKHSVKPEIVVEYLKSVGDSDCEVETDPRVALTRLFTRPEPLLLITGSFYLLNHIRPILL